MNSTSGVHVATAINSKVPKINKAAHFPSKSNSLVNKLVSREDNLKPEDYNTDQQMADASEIIVNDTFNH